MVYNKKDIESTIKLILSDNLDIEIDKINSNSLLVNDLGMNSLGIIETAFEIEERFKIDNISEKDLANVKTVQNLVDYIHDYLKNSSNVNRSKS